MECIYSERRFSAKRLGVFMSDLHINSSIFRLKYIGNLDNLKVVLLNGFAGYVPDGLSTASIW